MSRILALVERGVVPDGLTRWDIRDFLVARWWKERLTYSPKPEMVTTDMNTVFQPKNDN